MRRGLLILLGLLAVTWFEFQVYPGHSYLQGETQLLVPMLERLDAPGFLSRDLVASNPPFAFTAYDEITQALHSEARWTFQNALQWQQLLFRLAAVIGVFLLARSLRVSAWAAVLLSAVVNAVTHLAAPEAFVTSPEPTPFAFSFSLSLLAAGLLVNRTPLLAGLAGGLALLYDPVAAAPFWLLAVFASIFDGSMRQLLRPAWPSLAISMLILGNLMQLQSGLGTGQELTATISNSATQLLRFRTPWVWVIDWVWHGILSYKFLMVAGIWALVRLWKFVDRMAKWMIIGLISSGTLSVAFAMLLLDRHNQFPVTTMPARNLAYSVAVSALACGAASWHAAQKGKWRESLPWMALLVAAVLNAQVLDLLHGTFDGATNKSFTVEVADLARWADRNTWGSSLFQFPDAGRQPEPSVFRALSKRGLWADWRSGIIADYSESAGQQWWSRWQACMLEPYSVRGLRNMLPLPIDYYVLSQSHALAGVKPAYSNSRYVVYDAQDLREWHGVLKTRD